MVGRQIKIVFLPVFSNNYLLDGIYTHPKSIKPYKTGGALF